MRASRTLAATIALLGCCVSLSASQVAPTGPMTNGSIGGLITSTTGLPLFGVNVSLLGEDGGVVSDSAGRFVLREIKPGGHTLLLRRIGYHSVERRVTLIFGANLQFAVAMAAVPQQLERVVVEAAGISRRRGTSSIGGTVSDSTGRSVVGADVRLLGSGLSTTTDSSGAFLFQSLAAGPYIVRTRREGLAAGNAAVHIADDDDRAITMKMYGLPPKTRPKDVSIASGFGIPDLGYSAFDRRVRSRVTSVLFGPADMFRADRASLDFMFRQYREIGGTRRRSTIANEGVGSTEDGDCLLIDGRRAMYRPLSTYSSVSILLAEVFRANSSVDDFIVSEMQSLKECRGTMDHHPAYYVLWTRAMR